VLDGPEFDRWRAAAADALDAARIQSTGGHHAWACFLAEQAAELALKGLLHGIGAGAWGHDLVALGDVLAEQAGRSRVTPLAPALRRLSRHYIPARYPDAHPSGTPAAHYGPDDSDQALADSAEVFAAIDALWADLNSGGRHPDEH
jgi:HEPN domain-containing protein